MSNRITPLCLAVMALLASRPLVAQDLTLEGGAATTDADSSKAYSQVVPNLADANEQLLHDLGMTGFMRDFGRVKIGGSLRLGPQFNAPSCVACHSGAGRGALRLSSHGRVSDTVVKVGVPTGRASIAGAPIPLPRVGTQLQDHAIRGTKPEARISLKWRVQHGTYGDGTPYELREPILSVSSTGSAFPRGTMYSLRRAPSIFGSGLLEAVSSDEIIALSDPNDANGDGISGRPNMVWSVEQREYLLGRFGLKAGAPTLKQQVAAAYANDMGVSNPLFRAGNRRADIPDRIVNATTFFSATLAVPRARTQDDPGVVRGKGLFASMGCAACHVTELHTMQGRSAALSNTTIHPLSDLLLHDMGIGLADNRPEFGASGSEWRTAPLWGIGLTGAVLAPKSESYLHDGRARTLEEAILWHGGEGVRSQQAFASASQTDRDDLIRFLRSL